MGLPEDMKKPAEDFFKLNPARFEGKPIYKERHITKEILSRGIIEKYVTMVKDEFNKQHLDFTPQKEQLTRQKLQNQLESGNTSALILEANDKFEIAAICQVGSAKFLRDEENQHNRNFRNAEIDTLADMLEYEIKARSIHRKMNGKDKGEKDHSEKVAKLMYECGTAVGRTLRLLAQKPP